MAQVEGRAAAFRDGYSRSQSTDEESLHITVADGDEDRLEVTNHCDNLTDVFNLNSLSCSLNRISDGMSISCLLDSEKNQVKEEGNLASIKIEDPSLMLFSPRIAPVTRLSSALRDMEKTGVLDIKEGNLMSFTENTQDSVLMSNIQIGEDLFETAPSSSSGLESNEVSNSLDQLYAGFSGYEHFLDIPHDISLEEEFMDDPAVSFHQLKRSLSEPFIADTEGGDSNMGLDLNQRRSHRISRFPGGGDYPSRRVAQSPPLQKSRSLAIDGYASERPRRARRKRVRTRYLYAEASDEETEVGIKNEISLGLGDDNVFLGSENSRNGTENNEAEDYGTIMKKLQIETDEKDPNVKLSIYEKQRGTAGIYTPVARRKMLDRYLEKRKKRVWTKKIKYQVRKNFADARLRVKGRFISKEDEDDLRECLMLSF